MHETSGVTRDRKELLCEWTGTWFRLIDTGGVDAADDGPFGAPIAEQARAAIAEADLVLFVVDARAGVSPGDEELAEILRPVKKPVIIIANKLDDPRRDLEAVEFHRLGLGDPFPLSALHGHGTGDLLDLVVAALPGHAEPVVGDDAIRVAILGRPNVGKSSLLNALVGEKRVIVSDVPGTTRDTIDTVLVRGEKTFVLVDTAGLRRKRSQRQGIEYYSELRALAAAERADIALVLVDSSEGIVEQDLAVADVARKAGCSTLIVLSKWDIGETDLQEAKGHLNRRLRQRPPAVAVSAVLGAGPRSPARPCRGALREAHHAHLDAGAQQGARRVEGGETGPERRARAPAQAHVRDADREHGRRACACSSTRRRSSRVTMATGSRTSCVSGFRSMVFPSRSISSRASNRTCRRSV